MMKKTTLFLFLLLFSGATIAKWSESEVGLVSPTTKSVINGKGYISFVNVHVASLHNKKEQCDKQGFRSREPILVNGVSIKAVEKCTVLPTGIMIQVYPESRLGKQFLYHEFSVKESVKIDSTIFSTDGFNMKYGNLLKSLVK
ncbi:TPA: hypothetical protein ACX3GO_004496 [Vibrio parahaemolyticus]